MGKIRICLRSVCGAAVLGCALFGAGPGHALEWAPEYQSLTETEQGSFEGPSSFASEYSADVLSYMRPEEWQYLWLSQKSAYDLAFGSVGAAHFVIDQRLKLGAELTPGVEFRLNYVQEQNRERDARHAMLEFAFWPLRSGERAVGFALYGEPELYKRNNDTGIALMLKPAARHEIRLFNTFVDVTRLRRSDRSDNHVIPFLPYSRGLVGRVWSDPADGESGIHEFLEYALRYDTRTVWVFPDQKYTYSYWNALGSVFGRAQVAENLGLSLRVQFDRKFEGREPAVNLASLTSEELAGASLGFLRRDRLFAIARAEIPRLGPSGRWSLVSGVELANRAWWMDRGQVIYRDLLPHLLWGLPGFGSGLNEGRWTLGWVMSWHRAFGPVELRDPLDEEPRLEQKLNIGYEFRFDRKASVVLMVTGDLDRAFTRKSWDGGAAQVRVSL